MLYENNTHAGMFQPLHIPAGSFNANRIIEPLNEGRQILIEFEAANRTCKVTVRLSEDGVYYINDHDTFVFG